tara:strand:- start:232 stop:564 length:333 start_codon:yes stop_codon:yes gene_type:complete
MALSKKYPIIRPVVIFVLNILDVILTYYALTQRTGFYESNPIAVYLIGLGWGYAIFIKLFLITIVLIIITLLYGRIQGVKYKRVAGWCINILLLIYVVVVVNNAFLLFFT